MIRGLFYVFKLCSVDFVSVFVRQARRRIRCVVGRTGIVGHACPGCLLISIQLRWVRATLVLVDRARRCSGPLSTGSAGCTRLPGEPVSRSEGAVRSVGSSCRGKVLVSRSRSRVQRPLAGGVRVDAARGFCRRCGGEGGWALVLP
mgnify:CR=1 FL=1